MVVEIKIDLTDYFNPRNIYYRELDACKYQLRNDYIFSPTNPLYAEVPWVTGYELDVEYIRLRLNGELTAKKGYPWNGASGPVIDTPATKAGSLYHDPLYRLFRLGLLPLKERHKADRGYKRVCMAWKMSRFRAWYQLRGLKNFAAYAAKPGTQKRDIILRPPWVEP